ncbi:hypothetical protein CLF_113111, partial [Clonorchis sinensis]
MLTSTEQTCLAEFAAGRIPELVIRMLLSTVVVGESLPGREQEFDSIYTFISGKLLQGTGGY